MTIEIIEGLPGLIINGVSTTSGGHYNHVDIDGIGKIRGDIHSQSFKMNGQVKVFGELHTGELSSDGALTVKGRAHTTVAKLNGAMTVEGMLRSEQFTINGGLTVKGDCEVEQLMVDGGFTIEGLLNAGKLDVRLQGAGRAREIGVESIRVRRGASSRWTVLRRWMNSKSIPELHARIIEGDDIDLEYTIADIVRGNRVSIGKGCAIGRVEYRSELIKHPEANIGEEVKAND